MRSLRTALAVLAVVAVPAGAVAVPAAATAGTSASCPAGWGSLSEAMNRSTTAVLTNVRTGRHSCFDRVVFDISGKPPGYTVRYASEVFYTHTNRPMPLRGGAQLEFAIDGNEVDATGRPAFQPPNELEVADVTGYRTLRQVASGGSAEGFTVFGIGVRARLPFRVFTLAGPGSGSRLVIDIAHRW
ncbi:hypothetical protein AB0E63_26535 [Kribbella sp. NPDC026596]|uniref:AMIN-like domain-containing (lipo)protein n=1 Tax=Kribbella sp. NPDC026596 TaxID=3155122 RepID=UPI0033D84C52